MFPVLGQHAVRKVVKRVDPAVTAHEFRSTFSDWCAEQTSFPAEVREMALAHAVGDKVETAYRRGDLFAKRRDLAEASNRHADCRASVQGDRRPASRGSLGCRAAAQRHDIARILNAEPSPCDRQYQARG